MAPSSGPSHGTARRSGLLRRAVQGLTARADFGLAAGVAIALVPLAIARAPALGFDRFVLPKEALLFSLGAAFALRNAGAGAAAGLPRAPNAAGMSRDATVVATSAFLALSALSGLLAQNGYVALRAFGLSAAACAVFLGVRREPGLRGPVLAGVMLAGGLSALLALGEAHGLWTGLSTPQRAPSGGYGNRNALAHTVALSLPSALWYGACGTRRALRYAAHGAALFGVAAVALSRSRATWLGLAVALLVGLLVARPWRGRRLGLGLAVVAVGVGLALLPNRLHWRSATPYRDSLRSFAQPSVGSAAGRRGQAELLWALFLERPLLGVGPAHFRVEAPRVGSLGGSGTGPEHTPVRLPNDDWLGLLAERGAPAFLCVLALAFTILRRSWAQALRGGRAGAAAALASVALIAVMGSFDALLAQGTPALLAAASLGALVPAPPVQGAAQASRAQRAGWGLLACLCAVGFARGVLSLYASQLVEGQPFDAVRREWASRLDPGNDLHHQRLTEHYLGRGEDCARAAPHLQALRRLYPYDRRTMRLVERCQHPR